MLKPKESVTRAPYTHCVPDGRGRGSSLQGGYIIMAAWEKCTAPVPFELIDEKQPRGWSQWSGTPILKSR